MTRFADLIRDDGIDEAHSLGDDLTNRYQAEYIQDRLAAAPIVFDVSAVAQAVADGMPTPPSPPAMRPPYDTLWAECVVPGQPDGVQRVGALVETRPWEDRGLVHQIARPGLEGFPSRDPETELWVKRVEAAMANKQLTKREALRNIRRLSGLIEKERAAADAATAAADGIRAELDAYERTVAALGRLEAAAPNAEWIVTMHGYARVNGRNLTGFGRWHWALDGRGDPVASAHIGDAHTTRFLTIALAMSLTNCGNVDQDIHHPPAKLQRARGRRGKPPLVSYRTLVIRPMTRTGGTGPVDRSDAATRLHLRRGGFRDYRANGLFGRDYLRRVFWFSPTLVGREEHGRIDKDYEVATGDDLVG